MRLSSRQPMVIMYEDISELIVSVTMARRAVVEPMLIRERRAVTTKETITAFSGMFQPGATYSCQNNLIVCQYRFPYLSKELRKRETAIASKRPELARGSRNFCDRTGR